MDKSAKNMDQDEEKIQQLASEVNPSENIVPDSLAEATTAPLSDDALGGHATEDDVKKK